MIPVDEHDVLIQFSGKEAIVETRPETYVPEFLGQDNGNMIFYVDRPLNPMDDFSGLEIMAARPEAFYIKMLRKPDAKFSVSESARLLESLNSMPPNSLSYFAPTLNLFVGRKEYEMEQAELKECVAVEKPIRGVHMKFVSDDTEGKLLLPDRPALGIARVKLKDEFARNLDVIRVKSAF